MAVPTNNPPIDAVADVAEDLAAAVQVLKLERDTYRALAQKYQAAFEEQTTHLRELQDICFATQAELENERSTNRHCHGHNHSKSEVSQASLRSGARRTIDGADDQSDDKFDENFDEKMRVRKSSFGTATIYAPSHAEITWRPNYCFRRVENFSDQRDYGTALKEVENLLRGPLTPQVRVEGLLLKSNIMRKSDWLFDALASCSEALELCNRLGELHSYLPKIQYQRGICYYQLRMLKQARDAFNEVCAEDDWLYTKAAEMRDSCDDQLDGRRSGFEAHRTVTEGFLAQLHENCVVSKRRRVSQQLRYHATKAKRISLPQKWITPRSTSCGTN